MTSSLPFGRAFLAGWVLAVLAAFGAARWAAPQSVAHRIDDTSKYQLIDFTNVSGEPVDRHSETGRQITRKLYGPYADFIRNSPLPLSPGRLAEYTIPVVRVGERMLGIYEDPLLRVHLWRARAPQVVLFGSSMMFMNFSREHFFERYPRLHLLDFTMGDNIPSIAEYQLDFVERQGLAIPPGSLFIYGLNDAELFDGYPPGSANDLSYYRHVFAAFEPGAAAQPAKPRESTFQERVEALIGAPYARAALASGLDAVLVRLRLREAYGAMLPRSAWADPAAIQAAILGRPIDNASLLKDESAPARTHWGRIRILETLSRRVESAGARFVVVRVPNSTPEMAKGIGVQLATNAGVAQLAARGVTVIDARRHSEVGIDDTHFVFPGGRFDPLHMNPAGAERFTGYLLRRLEALQLMPRS